MRRHQPRQVAFRDRIAVQHEEGSVFQKWLSLLDPAAGPQQRRFVRVGQAHGVLRAVSKCLDDPLAEMVQIDDGIRDAVALEEQQVPSEDRHAPERQKGFGCGLRQRPQPHSEPG